MKFIDYLEEQFIKTNVYGETPITKENCEDLFDRFAVEMSKDELLAWIMKYDSTL